MSKWTDAVQKLVDLTRSGSIEWETRDETLMFAGFSRERVVGIAYFTSYLGKSVALYETRFETYDEDDSRYWKYVAILEFVTDQGALEWSWPVMNETRDLLEVVRKAKSGADDFLEQLLTAEVVKQKKK